VALETIATCCMALLDTIDVNILIIVLSMVVCKKNENIKLTKLNNILSITKGYWK
jgi:hypothetical protein